MTRLARRALLVAALPAALASVSPAADWSIRGFVSQRFEVSDNRGREAEDFGGNPELDAITDIGAAITARTPRAEVVIAPGVRGLFSTEETLDASSFAPRFNGSLRFAAPRSVTTASLSITPRFVSASSIDEVILDEEGVVQDIEVRDEEAVQIVGLARLGYAYNASARDELSVGAFARAREYLQETDDLSPTRSFGLNASWRRALTPRTSVSFSPSFQQFLSEDDDEDSSGQTFSLVAGASHRVNERFAINGGLGPSYTLSDGGSSGFGVVGDLGAAYRTARTSYTLSIAQTVDQDADGDVGSRVTARASAARPINQTSRLSLNAAFGFENPLLDVGEEEQAQVFTLTPSYAVDLTEDWSLNLGYRFAARSDDEDGFGASNSVFLQISRGLSILP